MEQTHGIEGGLCAARLCTTLAGERDARRLVERATRLLREQLQAAWGVAVVEGDGHLAGYEVAVGVEDADAARDLVEFDTEAPDAGWQVRRSNGTAGLCLWLPQHSRLLWIFGGVPAGAGEAWSEALRMAAAYVYPRLHDLLDLQRARRATLALERRVSDLSLLFKGLDVTLSSVELTKVLRAFLTCVTSGEAIGFNRAFLLLIDEERRELRGAVAVGPSSGEEAESIWKRLDAEQISLEEILRRAIEDPDVDPAPGSLADRMRNYALPLDPEASILARAASSTGIYNIHLYKGEGPEPFAEAFGAREFVVIPILGRERTLGVIVADNLFSGKPIADDRVFLLSGLANHVGVVIENALMFEDVSSRYAELNEVQYINRALLSSSDYHEVLRQIAQISASMLQATGSLLFVCEGEPPQPRLEMHYSSLGTELPPAALERANDMARETFERNSGVLDFDLESVLTDSEMPLRANLVSAPMAIDNEVVGVLAVYRMVDEQSNRPGRFDRHSKRFLSIIADQAAIAIQSGRRLQTIREDQKQIEKLNQVIYRNEKLAALGQASSQIAHEIRNPLTALGGFARRMLRSDGIRGEDREAVEVIVRETARLERILNDQLAFVRSARLQRAETSLNDVVHESLRLLKQMIEAHDVRVQTALAPELPPCWIDADRIKQVLVNLLMNAIAAVKRGGKVRITTRPSDDAVEIEMANDGPPIPPEVEATLFMPFATTRQEGTGLGLAVVHQIVTEHGGRIQVSSDATWGGIFRIQLPCRPASPDSATP